MNEPIGEHARKLERDAIVEFLKRRLGTIRGATEIYKGAEHIALRASGVALGDCITEIERGDHLGGGE